MKWLALIFSLTVAVPLLAQRMAKSERIRRIVVVLLGFDLFNPSHINLISDETYRGESRGIEVTSVDLLVFALALSQLHRKRPINGPYRFVAVRLIYFVFVLLSLTATPDMLRSSFSVWKLVRMYFTFSVLASVFLELAMVRAVLDGLALGVIAQGLMAGQQKFIVHMARSIGSQSHPNSLAMIVNIISPIAFALILTGAGNRLTPFVVLSGALSVVFSLSRGGMAMFVMAIGLVIMGSFVRGPTVRKVGVTVAFLVAGLVGLAVFAKQIIKRFVEAPKESELARKLFNQAAKAMADEHNFGIGINMYSLVLDRGGYADRLHIDLGDRNGIAHHIYWLTAAELGYTGCGTYLLMLATVYFALLRASFFPGVRGDIALGMTAGLTVTFLQGTAEWIARQTTMSYCFYVFMALASSFYAQRQEDKG